MQVRACFGGCGLFLEDDVVVCGWWNSLPGHFNPYN